MSDVVQVARRFARALDEEDYTQVRAMLGAAAEYHCRGQTFHGGDDITASYQGIGDAAQKDFDEITYESDVTPVDQTSALIHFIDHLRRGNNQHTFRCQQRITIDDAGTIIAIQHIDLPGQREALAQFIEESRKPRADD